MLIIDASFKFGVEGFQVVEGRGVMFEFRASVRFQGSGWLQQRLAGFEGRATSEAGFAHLGFAFIFYGLGYLPAVGTRWRVSWGALVPLEALIMHLVARCGAEFRPQGLGVWALSAEEIYGCRAWLLHSCRARNRRRWFFWRGRAVERSL